MKKIRTGLALFIVTLTIFLLPTSASAAVGIESKVPIFLIGDATTGEIYESQNIDEPRPIASLSKIMTLLVVEDAIAAGTLSHDDTYVIDEASAALAIPGNSHFGLKAGETMTVQTLLQGLMVVSGNDAANALAIRTAGSVPLFVEKMNAKAAELNLKTAVFYNPSGLQEGDHQNTMSARDMFALSRHLINTYPSVLAYAEIREIDMPERNYKKASSIPLVGTVPGVDGLKTGYTPEAGNCLVTTCDLSKINPECPISAIAVEMGISEKGVRDENMEILLRYTAENYAVKKLVDSTKPYTIVDVNSSLNQKVSLFPSGDYSLLVKKSDAVHTEVDLERYPKAPIAKGTVLGTVTVTVDEEEPQTFDLVVDQDISKADLPTRILRIMEEMFLFVGKVFH